MDSYPLPSSARILPLGFIKGSLRHAAQTYGSTSSSCASEVCAILSSAHPRNPAYVPEVRTRVGPRQKVQVYKGSDLSQSSDHRAQLQSIQICHPTDLHFQTITIVDVLQPAHLNFRCSTQTTNPYPCTKPSISSTCSNSIQHSVSPTGTCTHICMPEDGDVILV